MSPDTDRVLVLDANGQAGLSVVRSLGRRGVDVTAGSSEPNAIGRRSRYSAEGYRHPEIATSPERFVADLVAFLESVEHVAVVPVGDVTTLVLSKHKAEIERTGTTVAAPDWDVNEGVWDKGQLFSLADGLSVPAPTTVAPASLSAVADTAPELTYPALVKPRSKITWDDAGRYHRVEVEDSLYADDPDELVAAYRNLLERHPFLDAAGRYPLLQEYVEGTTTATVVLADDGDVRAHFQEERVRTHPSSGGNSTLLRAREDPAMLAHAREVVDAIDWSGPAMVEFMETPAGEHYLIEVNGRYWGSLPFAITAGLDVPWLHYRQLRGLEIDPPESYRTDRLQHRLVYGDLKWLGEQLRDGNPRAPLAVLWALLVAETTCVSVRDPLPTLETLRQMATLGASTLADRVGDFASVPGSGETDPRGDPR